MLAIQFGLSSCDSGDVKESINKLKEQKCKVSFISFLGQVFVTESIAKSTGGILNPYHTFLLID